MVHARDRQLAEATDLVEFLVIFGDPNASRLLRDDHQRIRVRRGRVLNQACCQVLVQGGLHFLGHDGIDALRPGRDRRASFRDRTHERRQVAGTKLRLGHRENVWKFAENIPQLFDGVRDPARTVKVKSHRLQT